MKELKLGELHIWQASISKTRQQLACLENNLVEDELEKANRFVYQNLRNNYIIAHGLLRQLLSAYLQMPAINIDFVYGEHGKPALNNKHITDLEFNMSHSGDLVLFAFTRSVAVGIDVEQISDNVDFVGIANRFFSVIERDELVSYPKDKQAAAFFRCWTRKEAFIKAQGVGLSYPLHDFAVSLGESAKLLMVRGSSKQPKDWTICDVGVSAGYAASLVVFGDAPTIYNFAC